MRKGQNRKVKIAGRASCLGLLALGFMLANPVVSSSVFAEEIPEDKVEEASEEVADDDIMVLADTPSTVTISFSPSAGSASLAPTTSAGQSAQIKVLATVSVQKSGGYSVYVKSNSQNLVGQQSSSNTIPGMQGSATYANIPVNTWGYYATEGSTVPDNATYKAISTTGNGDKITENTSNKITSDTKTIALSFAAKINDQKPADTYQNTVTMSVVSSPLLIAEDFGIGNMQEMTSTVCANAKDNNGDGVISGQLKDVRDGKYYWVSKLGDGKCWMTQNLDLDLVNGASLSSVTSDLGWTGTAYPATVKTWDPAYTTATYVTDQTILADTTGTRSWSLGNYRIINPDTSNSCGYGMSSAANCPSRFTVATTPTTENQDTNAHYILGNHYQWNAATAGTGGTLTSGQATDSICPRNWRLPTSTSTGEFQGLVYALGASSDITKLTQAPFYGVRGGYVIQDTENLFTYAGNAGIYWSSTPNTSNLISYALYFSYPAGVNPSNPYTNRDYGASVRCIAR